MKAGGFENQSSGHLCTESLILSEGINLTSLLISFPHSLVCPYLL